MGSERRLPALEGPDAYCALEGFDGLCRADRVDGETMELMTAIACGWIERLVGTGGDFYALLGRWTASACIPGSASSRRPSHSTGTAARGRALSSSSGMCVRDVLRKGSVGMGADYDGETGGPVGHLAWKMMVRSMTMYLTRSPPNLLMCMGSGVSFFGCWNGSARPRIL
ncbi:hypothetical protein QYE76_039579 [Lolium multiflorum]|uniref:Uncharacterized protein n=1 Tax=Lolium multiflorum TaxID=4521 RepID=A0AAD8TBR1_LOLMU|nr:hypothetical protein QYE76_039579 [Lolium multiflorum]